ncbi:MAG: thiol:disulfide interchange protein [Chelatococcus sp.]|nr:MAG: thiol:disulfide interchange protein [Chelatococcus sp.]
MRSRSKILYAAGGFALLALGGVAAFYPALGGGGNSGSCPAADRTAARMRPLAIGEVAAVQVSERPAPTPPLAFLGPDGKPVSLADFAGRTVLVNLWATWCAPCLHEMPALDRLQTQLGGDDFAVVAVNIDTRNLDKPKAWLADKKIGALTYYSDPEAGVFQTLRKAYKVEGMPVSLLIDRQGCQLAMIQGPADWASGDAKALVSAALGR